MDIRQAYSLIGLVRETQPLIHCITNYVTAKDVANMILACGASPVMADSPREAAEVTSLADGLLLNTGTPKDTVKTSMILSGQKANLLGRPVILDPVGIGISPFRTEIILSLLKEIKLSVIRGNASEIKFLLNELTRENSGTQISTTGRGVDVSPTDQITENNQSSLAETARALSAMTGAVTIITGSTDIVSTWEETCLIKNGSPLMSRITGAGCMLDGVLASYIAAAETSFSSPASLHNRFMAASLATAVYGLCGERAAEKTKNSSAGTGSFGAFFLDEISLLDSAGLTGGLHIEFS